MISNNKFMLVREVRGEILEFFLLNLKLLSVKKPFLTNKAFL